MDVCESSFSCSKARIAPSLWGGFKTGFLCVNLTVLELALETRLASNSRDLSTSVSQVLGLTVCHTAQRQSTF